MSAPAKLSVVIALYNAQDCVAALCERLKKVLPALELDHEILLVDDRSSDGSWAQARAAAQRDPRVKALRLSRNFGQHQAITAGLAEAKGRWVVVMDCDLQDAPEDIPALYAKAREGFDVVYALQDKVYASWLVRVLSGIYHALVRVVTGHEAQSRKGSFSVLSRRCVDAFLSVRDARRHYLLVLEWIGFAQTGVPVERRHRHAGTSSYSLPKLVAHAVDGLLVQSGRLLRWTVAAGLAAALAALAFMVAIVCIKWTHPSVAVGWSSTMATVLFLGGLILAQVGVLGVYLEKVFVQTKPRPLYLIDERVNLDA